MAFNQASQLASGGKFDDLRRRLIFLVLALLVYRLGTHIPVPGINPEQLKRLFSTQEGGILDLVNMFSGGALSRFSIFALGIMPYISASIIMQLMSYVIPALEQIKKEGEAGRRKITQYTRYATLALAFFQSYATAVMLSSNEGLFISDSFAFRLNIALILTTGTLFLMWLGEQITERGLGNGISIIIFAGIVAGLPKAIGGLLMNAGNSIPIPVVLLIIVLVILVTYAVVFIEKGQRRIQINYARRQQGNKVYGGQTSFLPLKLNMSGVIPPIFASAIILLPASLMRWISSSAAAENAGSWVTKLTTSLQPGQPVYTALYAAAIIFFCFFYTALVFNSRETADNLKKSGAFIPGYRPGEQTSRYIDKVLMRLTLAGAVYITLVCLLPEFLILKYNVQFYFGGTSLLIVVVVAMDFREQVQNYLVSQQYESLLKKTRPKK